MSAPDERAFTADVAKATFRLGVAEGRWKLLRTDWPFAQIGVMAKDNREFVLRFTCDGYPQVPPTAGPWDPETNAILAFDKWPRGAGGRVTAVFRRSEWKNGSALYLPCDREGIAGHDNWKTEMPAKIWRPADGIVQYLELVHELLHCRDYVQAPSPAA